MGKLTTFAILLGVLVLSSCEKRNVPMKHKSGQGDIMSKHNFRSAERDGYKVEVWTLGALGWPITPGYRVYVPNGNDEIPPDTVVRLLLKKNDAPGDLREVPVRPILKKTAIEGGYWENIRVDDVESVERNDKFIGKKGIWEINLDDPFQTDPRKPGAKPVPPGKYSLAIHVSINGGPEFTFDGLPYRFVGSHNPAEFKD